MTLISERISHARIGLYEKGLPRELSWEARLAAARDAGFDYLELSIDEADERLARLDWPAGERAALRRAIENAGFPILTMCLSAVRKYPPGSASAETRAISLDVHRKAIDLAADLGIRIIQVCGYDVFYEPRDEGARGRFIDGLIQAAQWAGRAGVMLGLENVDTPVIESMEKAVAVAREIHSPWVNIYPDIGNLMAAGFPPPTNLPAAEGRLVAVHVKDARPGEIRGVRFHEGIVPFEETFRTLKKIHFSGPITVEMWADRMNGADPFATARKASQFVRDLWNATR